MTDETLETKAERLARLVETPFPRGQPITREGLAEQAKYCRSMRHGRDPAEYEAWREKVLYKPLP